MELNSFQYISGRRAKFIRRPWTSDEKKAIFEEMGQYISRGKVPGKVACENTIRKHSDVLKSRDWKAIKYFIKNFKSSSVKNKTM